MWKALHDRRPRGHALDAADRRPVHRLLLWVLAAHVVGLTGLGVGLGHPPTAIVLAIVVPAVCLGAGALAPDRSIISAVCVAVGLVCSSAALIGLTGLGAARFHVFVVIGLVALYQSWVPLLSAAVLALAGQAVAPRPGFPTTADPQDPGAWLPAVLFGGAVLALCAVSALLWGIAERYRCERDEVGARLTDVELGRRRFVSELLVNLARRSQGMVYRQLEILAKLQGAERDPDVRAELVRLDQLAVRVRRNAGNLLVLAGEQAPRTGSGSTSLREVVRTAVAETEDIDRVLFIVDEQRTVAGRAVADLTHLLAEVVENAVRFSPPDSVVTVRSRPDHGGRGRVVTVEDWGVGMPEAAFAEANEILAAPPEIDLSVSQRLGLHVVARLAARHRIEVALRPGDDTGTVCSIVLPEDLFEAPADEPSPLDEGSSDDADVTGTTRLPLTPTAARTAAAAEPVRSASTQVDDASPTARAVPARATGAAEAVTARVVPPPAPARPDDARPTGPRVPAPQPPAAEPRPPAEADGSSSSGTPDQRPDADGATARVPAARPPATPARGVPSPSPKPAAADAAAPAAPATPAAPAAEPAPARPAAETATTRIPTTRPRPAPAPAPAEASPRPATPPTGVPASRRPVETSFPGLPAVAADRTAAPAGRTGPVHLPTTDPEQPGPPPDRAEEVGRPSHPRPVDHPAPAAPEPAAAMPRRVPGRRAPGADPLPAPFGSSGSWPGWWESRGGGDSPSPVSATAPSSTGPWPVVAAGPSAGPSSTGPWPAAARDAAPSRPRPPAAAPPAPFRPGPTTGPITWVDPPERDARRAALPSGRTLFSPEVELRRRVPQANLAPELRDAPPVPVPDTGPTPDRTRSAASALSRYQASREAAQAAVGADALAIDRSALPDRPIATNPAAERYTQPHPGESVPKPGTGRPRPAPGPDDVPLDAAGDERSTAPERTAPGGVPTDARPRPGTDRGAAGSTGTGSGEDRAVDPRTDADSATPPGRTTDGER